MELKGVGSKRQAEAHMEAGFSMQDMKPARSARLRACCMQSTCALLISLQEILMAIERLSSTHGKAT